ncbi:Ribonuclease H domain [Sesbania bispinosa]|nr:Ribonuclease H domain [Sesbania bispinosa]
MGPPLPNQVALNTDGSVINAQASFGGLLRNADGDWIQGFYGNLGCGDILRAELAAIWQGLKLCWELEFRDVKCMSDSQLALSLILGDVSNFHQHAGVVKEIRKLISQDWNVTMAHTLREGNQCADYLAKFGNAHSEALCVIQEPMEDLQPLISADALGSVFVRL